MANQSTDPQVDGDTLEPQQLVRSIIKFLGDDPDREGVLDTPKRVVKSWKEIFGGYGQDAKAVLGTTFEKGNYDQMIVCKDIEMYSTCEHHMIPFFGSVDIGYLPGEKVVGLSKLARLVEIFSRRLQIQENLTQQIADTLTEVLKPKGVIVIVEAKHLCMCARGVGKQNSMMITSAITGAFQDPPVRQEFLALVGK